MVRSKKVIKDIRLRERDSMFGRLGVERDLGSLYLISSKAIAMVNRFVSLCRYHGVVAENEVIFLCFTPSLSEGCIERTDYRLEKWQQYLMYGIDNGFNNLKLVDRDIKVFKATVDCLLFLSYGFKEIIESSAQLVLMGGDDLKVPHKFKKTSKYEILVSYTIPELPQKSKLFVNVKDIRSGCEHDYFLGEYDLPDDSRYLAGSISLNRENICIHPNKSLWGHFFSKKNNVSAFCMVIGDSAKRVNVTSVQ